VTIFTNIVIFISIFIFFSFSILGFGSALNRIIIKLNLNIGEQGIIGFFTLYSISLFLNFFFPLSLKLTLSILIIGNFLFLFTIKKIFNNFKYSNLIIIILSILCAITTNLHDDHLLYQLPYIDLKQNYKIIFGLVHLNDFLTYTHGFYDTMALFQVPFFGNRLVFLLPVIFLMFFAIIINEFISKEKRGVIFYFLLSILSLILLKFTRSKQYGTDIPVISLIFLVQLYILDYIKYKNIENFYKIIIFFSLAVFYKLYAIISFFYLIIFRKLKFKEIFLKKKLTFIIVLILGITTLSKSFISSGCFSYPISSSCINENYVKWSIGKDFVKFREKQTKAAVRGWLPYIKSTDFKEMLMPEDYLSKFKFNYHKNVFLDPDKERLLIVILISILFFAINIYINKFNNKQNDNEKYNEIYFCSIITIFLWFIMFPYSRYGGYAYLLFFLILSSNYFFRYNKCNKIFCIIIISVFTSFFLLKNLNRINNELVENNLIKKNLEYPIPKFNEIEFRVMKKNGTKFNISKHKTICGLVPFPCLPDHYKNLEIKIDKKLNYYFLYGNGSQRKELLIEEIKINDFMRGRPGYNESLLTK
jgi:hypothetical protein